MASPLPEGPVHPQGWVPHQCGPGHLGTWTDSHQRMSRCHPQTSWEQISAADGILPQLLTLTASAPCPGFPAPLSSFQLPKLPCPSKPCLPLLLSAFFSLNVFFVHHRIFLLEYNCFAVLCEFLLGNKGN